ncbi:MAG TPA: hypothetical protein DCS07_04900 [Bdellovibrionales bacterium]|nr:MAG: hypothetical protein A2Z97_03950 [Bdellovibrionales bacterium GWB1_52_6]OFZ04868.1 MAG: hypothetical protein A2X97_08800 [Bdellovibrionales bacterium GWA1_52_35]OFZ42314.1 MAG: hypothetical protein A2070_05520 [Bdellovibrionales bacterium GWC1_52_8]HAR41958.1 hypothetical protein [Bdellovibrionales bacterium]HCM38954.1 hypothetical protein [Bdellovibrionales bacterium]
MQKLLKSSLSVAAAFLVSGLIACSTISPGPREAVPNHPVLASSVEISYILGHSKYRIRMVEHLNGVNAHSSSDGKVLGDGRVDRVKYSEFKLKVSEFMRTARALKRVPAEVEGVCRNPFTVTLADTALDTLIGCRGGGDLGIGRLIREGEFLIYSKK